MAEGNGSYVTRAELKAHLDPMRDNIRDIRDDVKKLLKAQAEDEGRAEGYKDSRARVWSLAAFCAAVAGDIATIVWLTH